MAIQLRPYQAEAIQSVQSDWEQVRSTLLIMATGCGKTESFLGVLSEERRRCIEQGHPFRALIIAHTTELVTQPRDRIALNWRGKLPVPGIVQASLNECDAEIVVATVQTLDARRVSKQFPTFSHSEKTRGEQRFIEADTADKNLKLFDEFGDPIKVKVPKGYEAAVDPRNCYYVYTNGAPVMTDSFERANFENYLPYAGRYEPKHDENDFVNVQAIATGRRLRAVLEEDLGYWKFVYEDTGKPYTVPESKAHPLRQFKRLREILKHGKITHLVIDEAHHAPAASYRRVIRSLTAANPDLRILGVTATPERSDEIKMSAVFDSVAYRIDLFRAIYLLRCLCKYERVGVALPVDASSVMNRSSRKDDFTQSELAELGEILSQSDALHIVVDTWEQEAGDRRSIFYTATVDHARALCEIFQERGHAAAWVSGETPKDERESIVKRFRSGDLQVLTNCSVFSEGVDVPEIACVGMVRPTKSKTFYTQCAGRGLRNHPTKDALNPPCLIIDFVPQNNPQDLRMASDILGNRNEQIAQVRKAKEESAEPEIIEMLNEMESSLIQGEIIDVLAEGRQKRDVVIKRFDFFQSESPLDWFVDSTMATASIAKNHTMAVVSPQLDRLETAQELIQSGNWKPEWDDHLDRLRSYQLYAINGRLEMIQTYPDWEDAKKAAQVYADEFSDKHIGHASAGWRERPPSSAQLQRAREAGVENPERFNRAGDLSKAIAHTEAQTALKRAKVIK